jgi:hypothetical protein
MEPDSRSWEEIHSRLRIPRVAVNGAPAGLVGFDPKLIQYSANPPRSWHGFSPTAKTCIPSRTMPGEVSPAAGQCPLFRTHRPGKLGRNSDLTFLGPLPTFGSGEFPLSDL